MPALPRPAACRAPGKVILVGEHAVVHGEPAIALPVACAGVKASITPIDGPLTLSALGFTGSAASAPSPLQGLVAAARATLSALGAPADGLQLDFRSDLAHGRGLGSSASAAVALVRAIAGAYGQVLPIEAVLELASVAERHAHGNPSGLDAAVIAEGAPIFFQRGREAEPVAVGGPFHFVIADTGRARDTRGAVSAVAERLLRTPEAAQGAIGRLGGLATGCRSALATGDVVALGAYLDLAQRELESLGVGSTDLDALVRAARLAGALGAKLTGAGMGGCMLALASDADHQAELLTALTRAGAAMALPLTLESDPQ